MKDPKLPEFNTLVRIMATRCMLAAEYFCSGSVSKESFGHYGLATPIYTHFTVSLQSHLMGCRSQSVPNSSICRCLGAPSACCLDQLHPTASVLAV